MNVNGQDRLHAIKVAAEREAKAELAGVSMSRRKRARPKFRSRQEAVNFFREVKRARGRITGWDWRQAEKGGEGGGPGLPPGE